MSLSLTMFMHLELDRKAQGDLMLLAHLGLAGRASANQILGELVSYWSRIPACQDLSHKATPLVWKARKHLNCPPAWHHDRSWWSPYCYWDPSP